MRTMKHLAIAAMTATALALAGCGGGSPQSAMDGPSLEDRQMTQRNAISSAITTAETTVAGVNDESTDSEVNAADMAVGAARRAITAAADVPAEEKTANTMTVNAIANRLIAAKTSRTAAMEEDNKANRAAMAKTGKALHAALAGPAATNTALDNIAQPTLTSAGLMVDAVADAGTFTGDSDPDSVTLKAGDSAGSLGSWAGMDYALTTGTGASKLTNEARVYTNRGSPTTQMFVEKYGDVTEYTASSRTYNVGATADPNIKASAFPAVGVTTFTGAQSIPGTYDGADGDYKCGAAATCTAQYTARSCGRIDSCSGFGVTSRGFV